jgi:hypothetical protein
MGTINNGGQTLSFDYHEAALGKRFNDTLYKLISRGIHSGGILTRINDTSVSLSQMVIFFEDTTNEVGIKITTSGLATITDASPTKPFIIGRFSWTDMEDNYISFLSSAYADINSTDLVFGKCLYTGSIMSSTFDYCRKTWSKSYYEGNQNYYPDLYVVANEPYDDKVNIIKGGNLIVNGQYYSIADNTQSPVFTFPVTSGRIDLLMINESGNLEILKSTDTSTPSKPIARIGVYPLAYITFPAGATNVKGNYIQYINPNDYKGTNVTGVLNLINNTNSTSFLSGSVTISGGVGIQKNLCVGSGISCSGRISGIINVPTYSGFIHQNGDIWVS